ncbi:hypothetical protein EVAR_13019_1 [Eumeta japonica]|uniref:Uncharacterized protein n=1 Tax=Eumeta variegata TaxID=151549 RepID=A0A4C1TX99_EUMVA|nr:hypothetical protein EVAR_13019_1 [Eumeta japonica]
MSAAWFYITALLFTVMNIPADGQLANCFAPSAPAFAPPCQPPMIVKESRNLNSLLPLLIMLMNDNGYRGACDCGGCEPRAQTIPIPYPIPVPINSPVFKY